MRDTDWIILDELHKNPNITKVAAKLYITQPTLTKRLQAMEEEFQVRIVNRSTKGVEFTPEGEFLAGRARIFLSFMKETVRGVDAFKTSGCGTVRLASSFTFSRRQLAEILMAYKSEHPNISFEIQNLRSYELTRLVEEGGADGAHGALPVEQLLPKADGFLVAAQFQPSAVHRGHGRGCGHLLPAGLQGPGLHPDLYVGGAAEKPGPPLSAAQRRGGHAHGPGNLVRL